MDLKALRAVMAVAHHRNFTRAAEAMRIAQPALSAQLRHLEDELGLRLFERTTRRVEPTPAGRLIATRAEAILGEVDALRRDVANLGLARRGLVRIGARVAVNLGLPALLADFLRAHPEIDVTIREAYSAAMLDMLRARDLDVGFAIMSPDLNLDGLRSEPYVEEPFVLIVPPASELASRRDVTIPEIADLPLVMHREGSAMRRMVDAAFAAAGTTPNVIVESNETGSARQLVAEGIGAAIVPESVARSPGPAVACLQLVPNMVRSGALVWRRGVEDPSVASFVAFILAQPPNAVVRPLHARRAAEARASRKG
jgi:DNA-binding transcriptional LysR family regulator